MRFGKDVPVLLIHFVALNGDGEEGRRSGW